MLTAVCRDSDRPISRVLLVVRLRPAACPAGLASDERMQPPELPASVGIMFHYFVPNYIILYLVMLNRIVLWYSISSYSIFD